MSPRFQRLVARVDQPERAGDRGQHQRGIAHGRQLDEPNAPGELRSQLVGSLQREPGLADPARAGQRHQGRIVAQQQRADRRHVGRPPDERGARQRQWTRRH